MTTTKTIKVPVMGGGFELQTFETTNEFKGETLGMELTEAHTLQTEHCDHYESSDADGIEIHPGFWVKKSLVKSIEWIVQFGTVRTVSSITFARPI